MSGKLQISKRVTTILVFGRPPLVFLGMICAIGVMWTKNPILYMMGILFLFISMTFDLIDGWFAGRFGNNSILAHLADKVMDKIVYSFTFPVIAVGMMWRLNFILTMKNKIELLHVIFVMILCVTVLIRDNFANFMRSFGMKKGQEPEHSEFTRLRTIVAAPVSAFLYAYAFYIPEGPDSSLYFWLSWIGNIPLRGLFFIEIIFLTINFASIAGYCRKYGSLCLDDLCGSDEMLRRRILSFFPNSLTIMNAVMGLLAVFFAYQDRIREAYLILIGAALFDKFDGALARKLGLTEPFPGGGTEVKKHAISIGGVLDDISDAISFCIAPAWIFYITVSNVYDPMLQKLPLGWIALLYAGAGIGRLIYFTLDTSPIPGFFKGMPTPAGALFVAAPLIILNQAEIYDPEWIRFWGFFCVSVMILSSVLMNFYPIKYLHIGRYMSRNPWFGRLYMLLLLIFIFTPFFGHFSLFCLSLYILSPITTGKIDPNVASKER
ncbi:MAG: CDP-alcohol phosphatidyltransferase family protein [Desulfobacterales bacterium]|nr:CDP-alcohol phosphatidyltransferase family protein [Desulfobacterales bacterium]